MVAQRAKPKKTRPEAPTVVQPALLDNCAHQILPISRHRKPQSRRALPVVSAAEMSGMRFDRSAAMLFRRIRDHLPPDHAIRWGKYMLHYVEPERGYPYYALSWCFDVVGVAMMWGEGRQEPVQRLLARYLRRLGCPSNALIIYAEVVSRRDPKDLRRLFPDDLTRWVAIPDGD
jgi:hypothetical protein